MAGSRGLEATAASAITLGSKASALALQAATPGTPIGVQIAAGSYERLLFGLELLHDAEAGYGLKPLYIYSPHTGCIKALGACRKYLASGSTDEVIRYADARPPVPLEGQVAALTASIAVAAAARSLRLYDVRKRVELGTLLQHQGAVGEGGTPPRAWAGRLHWRAGRPSSPALLAL